LCRDYSDKIFKDFKWLDKCLGIQNDKYFSGVGACIGKGAVLRISFGTFLFFAVHFVALLGELRLQCLRKSCRLGALLATGNCNIVWQLALMRSYALRQH
jgi:hypothetical protein